MADNQYHSMFGNGTKSMFTHDRFDVAAASSQSTSMTAVAADILPVMITK